MKNIVKRISYKCKVVLKTGMHIGGNKDSYGIGGIDTPVIKNPLDGRPILPGSSLKGKIRFLLSANGTDERTINEVFGNAKNDADLHFTRFLFRDFVLTDESAEQLEKKLGDGIFTEVKAENSIDNKTGMAISPRFIERVPMGAIFEGEIVIQILDGDNEQEAKDLLEKGFELLEQSYLGGSGSRGYGQVGIEYEVK